MARATQGQGQWRSRLYKKSYTMEAWDWKEDPRSYIRALCRPFGIRPRLADLVAEYPERLLGAIARKRRLHLYDVPGLEGSDVYGFILSKEKLTAREVQQIEADYWSEDFAEVYGGFVNRRVNEIKHSPARKPSMPG
jgi:hypothetical protein